jgi:hypothetical protein
VLPLIDQEVVSVPQYADKSDCGATADRFNGSTGIARQPGVPSSGQICDYGAEKLTTGAAAGAYIRIWQDAEFVLINFSAP